MISDQWVVGTLGKTANQNAKHLTVCEKNSPCEKDVHTLKKLNCYYLVEVYNFKNQKQIILNELAILKAKQHNMCE